MKVELLVEKRYLDTEISPILQISADEMRTADEIEIAFTLSAFVHGAGCQYTPTPEKICELREIAQNRRGTFCCFVNSAHKPEIVFYPKGRRYNLFEWLRGRANEKRKKREAEASTDGNIVDETDTG